MYDFENICRTCLSTDDLNHLYKKCFGSTCVADMLMSFSVIKCTEDDGLPVKICSNCINEINRAFWFTKRCETSDKILRKYLNPEMQQKILEEKIKREEKPNIEIKEEIVLPDTNPTVLEVMQEFDYAKNIKREEEIKPEIDLPDTSERVEEVSAEHNCTESVKSEVVNIENEENVRVPLEENAEVQLEENVGIANVEVPLKEDVDQECSENVRVQLEEYVEIYEKTVEIPLEGDVEIEYGVPLEEDVDLQYEENVEGLLEDDVVKECVESVVQLVEDVNIENEKNLRVQPEKDVTIVNKYADNPANESSKENVDHDKTSSEIPDNLNSTSKRRLANYQIDKISSKEEYGPSSAKRTKNILMGVTNYQIDKISSKEEYGTSPAKTTSKILMRLINSQLDEKKSKDTSLAKRPNKILMRIHTRMELCACGICNKNFDSINDLETHMKIHKKKKLGIWEF